MSQPLTEAEVQKVTEFADNPTHVESLSRLLVSVTVERLVECLVLDVGHGELLVRALKKAFALSQVRIGFLLSKHTDTLDRVKVVLTDLSGRELALTSPPHVPGFGGRRWHASSFGDIMN